MTVKKKVLVLTGGGDCPGLNAVIRGIVKRARVEKGWEVYGSIEAFNGIMKDPPELVKLTSKRTAGIHVKGGTILKTTNKGNPLSFPVENADGTVTLEDRSDVLKEKLAAYGFDAVINIGGDGSQKISQHLFEKGVNVIGVPKTIDNDLSSTDLTFGFTTAVQVATDSFDKLVTTAESHHRIMIMEVMGRDAGWIALHTAIAGGAEICLIPEIPYDIDKLVERIDKRYYKGRGFVNIVISEGAHPKGGEAFAREAEEKGYAHKRLGGVAYRLTEELRAAGCKADIREAVLGHTQRGGSPVAFDRILASLMGVKAFELVRDGKFGQMTSYRAGKVTSVPLKDAVKDYNFVKPDSFLVQGAKGLGISFGD